MRSERMIRRAGVSLTSAPAGLSSTCPPGAVTRTRGAPPAPSRRMVRLGSPFLILKVSEPPACAAAALPSNRAVEGRQDVPRAHPLTRAGLQVAIEEPAQEGALPGDCGRRGNRAEFFTLGGQAELRDQPDVIGEPGVLGG